MACPTWVRQSRLFNPSSSRLTNAQFRYLLITFVVVGCLLGLVQRFLRVALHRPYSPRSWRASSLIDNLQKHLVLPALFNGRLRQPLPLLLGYLPSRLLTLFLISFGIVNLGFLVGPYHLTQPNAWFATSRDEIINLVADRAGILSFALLPLTVLLSARNSPLQPLTHWSATTYITLHRWVARTCVLHGVIHSIAWTVAWRWTGPEELFTQGQMPYMIAGFIGTVSMCLMIGFATWWFRARFYDLFLVLHIMFGLFVLLGCWYHIDYRFYGKYGYKNWL